MPGARAVEAVVLRSFRYGEADRVLHLLTRERGRVGAVAKGVRRTRSRVGGRLEPLSHVEVVLHAGRGELATVGSVELLDSAEAVRGDPYRLGVALVGVEAVTRLFPEPDEPNGALFDGLLRFLAVAGELPRGRCRRAGPRRRGAGLRPQAAGPGRLGAAARRLRGLRLGRPARGLRRGGRWGHVPCLRRLRGPRRLAAGRARPARAAPRHDRGAARRRGDSQVLRIVRESIGRTRRRPAHAGRGRSRGARRASRTCNCTPSAPMYRAPAEHDEGGVEGIHASNRLPSLATTQSSR